MKSIFKWLTVDGGDPKASAYTYWFANMFEPKDFTGINRLLFCYVKYCAKLAITPKQEFLDAYLLVDGKADVKRYNVKTDTMSSYDYTQISQLDEAYRIIRDLAKSTYSDYMSEDLTGREFKVDVYGFMSRMKSQAIEQALMDSYPHLTDGSDVSEVSSTLQASLADIEKIYDTSKIDEIDFAPSSGESNVTMKEYVCDTGLPAIDGDAGGIYTRTLTTLTAQPKGGKTRISLIHWIYSVLMAGYDAVLYENELTKTECENILIAYHIVRLYQGRIKIPDSTMNKNKMTEEQKQIYESARIDLFESEKYGKLYFKNPFVVEDARSELLAISKASGKLKLVVVDYMGLSKSRPVSKWDRKKEEYEIIAEGYKELGELKSILNVHVLCINQFNDKGIDAAYAGKPLRPGMIQGGHIVERHTDYNIYMTYTEEQKLARVRTLTADLVRGAEGFENALVSVDLSVSIFRQELTK